jgi:hypothetical protein
MTHLKQQEVVMAFEERNYLIFSTAELDKINFDQVLETSAETVRLSVDETKTFVKWEGEPPQCLSELTTAEGPYTHTEILEILSGEQWSAEEDGIIA